MDMDLYEREVKVIMERGGVERLKKQYMILSKHLDNIFDENKELKKQIAELETELSAKEDLMSIMRCYIGFGNTEALKKYGIDITSDEKEPLPFSDEQYEEEKINKIEKAVLGIQGFLKKETEQKIKKLEEEQARLMYESAYYRFLGEATIPLKPTSEVHRMGEL